MRPNSASKVKLCVNVATVALWRFISSYCTSFNGLCCLLASYIATHINLPMYSALVPINMADRPARLDFNQASYTKFAAVLS